MHQAPFLFESLKIPKSWIGVIKLFGGIIIVATAVCERMPFRPADHSFIHGPVAATYFWVGEPADSDNAGIPNDASAWDSYWQTDFGGVDDPANRNGYFPSGFTPKENPFYCALPYNDLDVNGKPKPNASRFVYWANGKPWPPDFSFCKNHWVHIIFGQKDAYAQWEDCGPFGEDDTNYVFGTSIPVNTINDHAGIDVSPAVKDFLSLGDITPVSWQFVDDTAVPDGPWKQIITISEVH
jgi:hypothetical protein